MSVASKPITADDLFAMPHDGVRRELVCGELRAMTPAGFEHGGVAMRLSWRLAQFIESQDLGVA